MLYWDSMNNTTFFRGAMVSIAVAAVAASLLTVAGAIDVPHLNKTTASGKLAALCGVAYDKAAYKELHSVLENPAAALEKLGLGNTKADVCAEVVKIANAKADPKIDYAQYANAAYGAQAMVNAAVLYRASALGASIDKPTLTVVGKSLEVPTKTVASWKAGAAGQTAIKTEGKAFLSSTLAQAGRGDLDSTSLKDPAFSSFVYNLNLSP